MARIIVNGVLALASGAALTANEVLQWGLSTTLVAVLGGFMGLAIPQPLARKP